MQLAELQQAFWQAVRTRGAPPSGLDELFTASRSQSGTERLGVYHRAYWQRQVTALSDTFKRCQVLLGPRELERLLLAYIETSPSRHPCIERSGAGFAEFLALRPRVTATARGLAQLEWAALAALLARDPAVVVSSREVGGEAFATNRLSFVPSLQVELVPRAAWDFLQGDEAAATTAHSALVRVAIWRPRFGVRQMLLEQDEARALELARGGAEIALVCTAFTASAEADAIARAVEVLSSWFAREWISRCAPGQPG